MKVLFFLALMVYGAVLGSFVCCQVRRMRAKQKGKKIGSKRSVCLKCGYELRWYDNIPIFSWFSLMGKCRNCKEKIGVMEIIAEVGLCLAYVLMGACGVFGDFSMVEVLRGILILIFFAVLLFLALYDGAYGELPIVVLFVAVGIGSIIAIVNIFWFNGSFDFVSGKYSVMSVVGSVLILGGVYLLLLLVSKGKWVGDGDWILGTAIGLALSNWWLALLTVFVSNLFACIVMIPVIKITKKLPKKKKIGDIRIYFGPWMVVGCLVVMLCSNFLFEFAKYLF